MRRFLRILGGVLLALTLLLAGGVFFLRDKGQPLRSGEAGLAGLSAAVEVRFDHFGVPHVLASEPIDLASALGYLHANERMTQLELGRRSCSGRLAEIVGKDALPLDRRARTLRLRATAERLVGAASAESQAWLGAYARGVNTWLNARRGDLPPELTALAVEVEPWSPVDSLCFVVLMARDLSIPSGFAEEGRYRLLSKIGVDRGRDLLGFADLQVPEEIFATAIASASIPAAPRALAPLARAALFADDELVLDGVAERYAIGSNNWAVGNSRTSTGAPLVANDPHLGLSLPSIWYQVHLRAPGFEVAGMTLPGVPGVVLGQGASVAWAFTNVELDDHDLFFERLSSDGRKVARGSAWLSIVETEETIRVKGGAVELLRLQATDRGPLLAADPARNLPPRSLAWTAYELADPLSVFLALARARNVDEALASLDGYVAPAQNLVIADREGGMAYGMLGRLPARRRGDGRLPSPGWDLSYGWQALRPRSDNPTVLRPAEDLLVTANNDILPPGYALPFVANFDRPHRANRIRERLLAESGWRAETLAQVQIDTTSLYARAVVRALPGAAAAGSADAVSDGTRPTRLATPLPETAASGAKAAESPFQGDARLAYEALARWDGAMELHGPSALFALVRRELETAFFADEAAQAQLPRFGSSDRVLRLLRGEMDAAWFDDVATSVVEDRQSRVTYALARAWAEARERFASASPESWDYGRLHRLRLRHPLGFVPVVGRWFERGPIPIAGSSTSIAAFIGSWQTPDQEEVGFGPSMRWVSDLADPDRSLAMLPGGQAGHPADQHYADQLEGFVAGQMRAVAWSEAAILRATISTLRLVP